MKNIITTLYIIIIFIISCKAQQPITKISSNTVKAAAQTYNLKKSGDKYVEIKNKANKLTNVYQIAPNLPSDVKISYNIKFDKGLIDQICADAISYDILKKMPLGINDRLSIYLKVNEGGFPIEMEFIVRNTSLITASNLQQIEQEIKESNFKITFLNGIERYFKGANYFTINIPVTYSEMLKTKKGN